jgi:hypothetical protein
MRGKDYVLVVLFALIDFDSLYFDWVYLFCFGLVKIDWLFFCSFRFYLVLFLLV